MDLPTSVDLATNKLIATTLSGIAEFENAKRKERQQQGIRAAQKEGKYTGRKTVINQRLITKGKNLKDKSNLSVTEISRLIGISRRPTVYKVLKEHLGYVSNKKKKMNQNKLSFKSEKLVVDWIEFNIQAVGNIKQVEIIANSLFQNFGFNSTFADGLDGNKKTLFNDSKNEYQVSF